MVPEAISSRQCSANTPIQGQSNANRDPVLDWRFLVNPRKSRSILCNANTNSVPIGAQTDSSSVANPMPIGANPLPIHCQSSANPVAIRGHEEVRPRARGGADRRRGPASPPRVGWAIDVLSVGGKVFFDIHSHNAPQRGATSSRSAVTPTLLWSGWSPLPSLEKTSLRAGGWPRHGLARRLT